MDAYDDEAEIGHIVIQSADQAPEGGCKPNDKLHAGKAYDHCRCRHACQRRSVKSRIARRGIDSSPKLGRHRWVIERTFAWINRFRRRAIRYERRLDIHQAFTAIACSLICLNALAGRF